MALLCPGWEMPATAPLAPESLGASGPFVSAEFFRKPVSNPQ